jgi:hypothetical protein
MGYYGDFTKGENNFLFLEYCSKGTLADLIKEGIEQVKVLKLFR